MKMLAWLLMGILSDDRFRSAHPSVMLTCILVRNGLPFDGVPMLADYLGVALAER